MNINKKRRRFVYIGIRIFLAIVAIVVGGFLFSKIATVIGMWSTRTGVFVEVVLVIATILYLIEWLIAEKGKKVVLYLGTILISAGAVIARYKYIQAVYRKYPELFIWLKCRIDRRTFVGLPLTILVSSLLYFLLLLGGIAEDVLTSDIITSVDTRVSSLFLLFREVSTIHFFTLVTLLGNWHVITGFILATISMLWMSRRRVYIASLLVAVIGAVSFSTLGKIIIQRSRPDSAIYVVQSFSFPSGHATIAMVFYGFVTYILIQQVARWKTKANIFFAGASIIALIGLSRLYLGMHYVSDILGGYLVGVVWLIIGISISEWLLSRSKSANSVEKQHHSHTFIVIASSIIISISFGWYMFSTLQYYPQLAKKSTTARTVVITKFPSKVLQDKKLQYTKTVTGVKQEPLSIILTAPNDDALIRNLKRAGWMDADTASLFTVFKTARAEIFQQQYRNAPMTPSFWNGRANDFGFEMTARGTSIRKRHHIRIWKTNYQTTNGSNIYVGVASFDMGIKLDLIHKINPDIDTERNFLLKTIQRTVPDLTLQKVQFVDHMTGENFYGDSFFTDGKIYIIYLSQ